MPPLTPYYHIILALFGAAFGMLWSVIFLLMYYGQQFSIPVSDAVRMRSAFIIATLVIVVVVALCYRKQIVAALRRIFTTYDELEDDTE
jgi:hypothetical protein